MKEKICPDCNGRGFHFEVKPKLEDVTSFDCPTCKGTGKVPDLLLNDEEILDVYDGLPDGLSDIEMALEGGRAISQAQLAKVQPLIDEAMKEEYDEGKKDGDKEGYQRGFHHGHIDSGRPLHY